jgi:hypothetical protein
MSEPTFAAAYPSQTVPAAGRGPSSEGVSPGRPHGAPPFREVLGQDQGARGPDAGGVVGDGLALLRGAARSMGRGDALLERAVRAARGGHVFRHEELLALQAGVYRHTQELELTSKLVDKGTSAVRQVLSSQQ